MASSPSCGAGPGDADLLTLGALKTIQSAQALLYDALVSEEILALSPARCIKICVGKRGDRLSVSQDKTNALMVRPGAPRSAASCGSRAGDPSVFGRVEEEREYLDHHGIAGIAPSPASPRLRRSCGAVRIPLTHRGEARSVTFLTGRTRDGQHRSRRRRGACAIRRPASSSTCRRTMPPTSRPHLQAAGRRGRNAARPGRERRRRAGARAVKGRLDQLAALAMANAWDGLVLIGIGSAFAYARIGQVPAVEAQAVQALAGMTAYRFIPGHSPISAR